MARKIAPRPRIDRRFESSLVQLEITNVSKAGATCQRERTEAIYEQRDWGRFIGFCIVNDEILEMGKECDRELGMSVLVGAGKAVLLPSHGKDLILEKERHMIIYST